MMARSRGLYVYAAPYVIISSLQYWFTKDGLRYADPLSFMAGRYLLASLATFLFARSFRLRINRDTVLLALFNAVGTVLWIYGLQRISPAQSAVFSYTSPLFAIPVAAMILNERASRWAWMGTLLGFVGVIVYGTALAGSGATLLGGLLMMGSAVFGAFQAVFFRKTRNQDAAATVGTMLLISGTLIGVLAPITFSVSVTPEFLLDFGYVSVISGFANFLLWNAMLRRESVGRVVTISFAVPAMTTLIEALETGVIPGLVTLSGIGIMFLGIYISRYRGSHETSASSLTI